MPCGQRRELYEAVIAQIRLFNRYLHVVPAMPEDGDPVVLTGHHQRSSRPALE
jgi:hypothetical protein